MLNERGDGIQCPKCKTKIFSDYGHDFKYCPCGACFVDGGYDYLRYGYTPGIVPKVVKRPNTPKKSPNKKKVSK